MIVTEFVFVPRTLDRRGNGVLSYRSLGFLLDLVTFPLPPSERGPTDTGGER